ncbi:MAG: hypothetical protein V4519_03040 [Patescibacteria group bacterium]
MFSFFAKAQEEVVAVFDIGNGSIGVAFVQLSHHTAPVILYVHREPISFLPEVTADRLLANMLKLLKSVTSNLQKTGMPHLQKQIGNYHVKRAFCTYSSPWYISQTKVVRVEEPKLFTVTKNVIDNVVRKEEAAFMQSLKDGKYEKMFGLDAKLMERRIIHTRLNGYEVQDPFNKRVKELEISFFSSFISKTIIEQVEKTLHSFFGFTDIKHGSYALSSWSAVRDMYHNVNDFLFLDISNEVTDVVLSYKGVLAETISFPMGRSAILRAIAKELAIPPEIAQSFLSLYIKKTVEKNFSDKIGSIILAVTQEWNRELTKALIELETSYPIPRHVFITADSDVSSVFVRELSKSVDARLSVPQNTFEVTVLGENSVRPYVHATTGLSYDPFLSLESMFLNKIAL